MAAYPHAGVCWGRPLQHMARNSNTCFNGSMTSGWVLCLCCIYRLARSPWCFNIKYMHKPPKVSELQERNRSAPSVHPSPVNRCLFVHQMLDCIPAVSKQNTVLAHHRSREGNMQSRGNLYCLINLMGISLQWTHWIKPGIKPRTFLGSTSSPLRFLGTFSCTKLESKSK